MIESAPKRPLLLPACIMVARPEPLTGGQCKALEAIHGSAPAFHYNTDSRYPIIEAISGLETLFKNLFVYTDSALSCMACSYEAKRVSTQFGFFEPSFRGILNIYHLDGCQFVLKWTGVDNKAD